MKIQILVIITIGVVACLLYKDFLKDDAYVYGVYGKRIC